MARSPFRPRPDGVDRRVVVITIVLLVIGVGVDLAIGASLPGYAAAIGLIGCLGIIVISKWLGVALILRPEDHYPNDIPPDRVDDLRG